MIGSFHVSDGHANTPERISRYRSAKSRLRTPLTLCPNIGRIGDIQSNISFDGKWVAFSRSLPGNGGTNDYHSWTSWDIYIVRVDGALPATPIRVGHGYWPSWSDDSTNAIKTLYYS